MQVYDVILAFIKDMSVWTAIVLISPGVCMTILIIVRSNMRTNNAVLEAKNTRREQEINQINHTLNSIANQRDQRIMFLEGKLQERAHPRSTD